MKPEQYAEHARAVQEIWQSSTWNLTVPVGHSAPGRNRAFGLLPSPRRPAPASNPVLLCPPQKVTADVPKRVEPQPAVAAPPGAMEKWRLDEAGAFIEPKRRVRRSLRSMKPSKGLGPWGIVAIVFAIFLVIFILMILSTGGRVPH